MRKYVVTFADGVGNYAKAMMRQELSMKAVGFGGEGEIWKGINDYAHIGSPLHKGNVSTHSYVPYAFKAYSIKKAIEEGAELILWLDSVIYATKSIKPVFDYILREGYMFFDNISYTIGDYTSDACLDKFGMSRDEAFKSPMIMACCMGFNIHNKEARKFLDAYILAASDGVSYHGDWTNDNLQVSNDMRVKGTRHDQSVASILIKQMGLKIIRGQDTFFSYVEHKGVIPVADSVCLWSSGI